jgi:hypothetical protein
VNLFRDVVYPLAGMSLIVAGAAWVYRPLGLIVAGFCLVFLAMVRPKAQ